MDTSPNIPRPEPTLPTIRHKTSTSSFYPLLSFLQREIIETFIIISSSIKHESDISKMARTTRRQIVHRYYQPPQLPNDPRLAPLVRGSGRPQCFASPNEETTATPINEDSLILLPQEYNGDDEDEYWRNQSSAQSLFKTCIAYEQIGEDSPRIVRYVFYFFS